MAIDWAIRKLPHSHTYDLHSSWQSYNRCLAQLTFPDHALETLADAFNAILRIIALARQQADDFAFAGAGLIAPLIRVEIERLADPEFVL